MIWRAMQVTPSDDWEVRWVTGRKYLFLKTPMSFFLFRLIFLFYFFKNENMDIGK